MIIQKKIILGAAQFGNKYGIYTKQTKMKDIKEIKKILKYSLLNKINYLDTAQDYQNSEKIIGKLSKKKFKIISKIKVKRNLSAEDLEKSIIKKTLNSLSYLKISKIYILHLHNVDIYLDNKKYLSKIYNVFINLKKKGLISKIGISTYYPEKIHKIYRFFRFEAVQVPFNIFDQRLLDSNIYKLNKFNKIEIHVRSIFLQGILLTKNYPMYFKKWKKNIQKYLDFLNKNQLNSIEVCLSFVKSFKKFKGIIFGVQNYNQLKEIIRFNNLDTQINQSFFKRLKIRDKNLLIPSYWKKSR